MEAGFAGAGTDWFYGDFDLDGAVCDFDFALAEAGFMGGGASRHLPEPGSLALLSAGLLARRGRRSTRLV